MAVKTRDDVQIFHVDPTEPVRVNDITSQALYLELLDGFYRNGWDGPPVVVLLRDHFEPPARPLAITGSHRLAAAEEAGMTVPCVDLDELFESRGLALDDLLDEWIPEGVAYSDGAVYRAIARVLDRLPIWMTSHYDITLIYCRGTAPAADGHQHLCNVEPEHELDDEPHECEVCGAKYDAASY